MRRPVSCNDIARAVGMDCLILGDETRMVRRTASIDAAMRPSVLLLLLTNRLNASD
jgi:hypothetical protein